MLKCAVAKGFSVRTCLRTRLCVLPLGLDTALDTSALDTSARWSAMWWSVTSSAAVQGVALWVTPFCSRAGGGPVSRACAMRSANCSRSRVRLGTSRACAMAVANASRARCVRRTRFQKSTESPAARRCSLFLMFCCPPWLRTMPDAPSGGRQALRPLAAPEKRLKRCAPKLKFFQGGSRPKPLPKPYRRPLLQRLILDITLTSASGPNPCRNHVIKRPLQRPTLWITLGFDRTPTLARTLLFASVVFRRCG